MELHRLFPWYLNDIRRSALGAEVAALIVVLRHASYMLLYAFAITAGIILAGKVL